MQPRPLLLGGSSGAAGPALPGGTRPRCCARSGSGDAAWRNAAPAAAVMPAPSLPQLRVRVSPPPSRHVVALAQGGRSPRSTMSEGGGGGGSGDKARQQRPERPTALSGAVQPRPESPADQQQQQQQQQQPPPAASSSSGGGGKPGQGPAWWRERRRQQQRAAGMTPLEEWMRDTPPFDRLVDGTLILGDAVMVLATEVRESEEGLGRRRQQCTKARTEACPSPTATRHAARPRSLSLCHPNRHSPPHRPPRSACRSARCRTWRPSPSSAGSSPPPSSATTRASAAATTTRCRARWAGRSSSRSRMRASRGRRRWCQRCSGSACWCALVCLSLPLAHGGGGAGGLAATLPLDAAALNHTT